MTGKYNFKQGDLVDFDIGVGVSGVGEIVGATTAADTVFGVTYIVRVVETTGSVVIPNEEYPFNTIACREDWMKCKL